MFKSEYDIQSLQKIIPTGHDFEMLITPRYVDHFLDHSYEPLTCRIISSNLVGGGIFVDIGAHFGFYTLLAGRLSKVSKILAFEPVPINFQILQQNIEQNKLRNVELFNLAVSDRNEVREFKITEASDLCGFYEHPIAPTIEEIEVKTKTIDSILKDSIEVRALLKIDAGGHEISVLDGMKDFISSNQKNLKMVVKYNPKLLENAKHKPSELVSKLFSYGFTVFIIDEEKGLLKKIDQNQVGKNYKELSNLQEPDSKVNLFCVPTEQALSVIFFSHSSEMNGAERSLLNYVSDLTQNCVECTVILPSEGKLRTNLEKAGAFTLIFPYTWWSDKNKINLQIQREQLSKGLGNVLNELYPLLVEINPDIIVTNTTVIPWGAICALLLNKPHIWYIQEFGGADHELRYFYPQQIISRYIEGSSNSVITNSNAVKKHHFGETVKDNIKTIHLPIDYAQIKKLSSENRQFFQDADSIKLVVVGTIQAGKGQIDAIDAVNELVRLGKKVELILAGGIDPNYYETINSLIHQYNLQSFIQIYNFLDNPYPLIAQSDLALVCSRNEAFGLVTLEAMSLGKPVIATSTGGTPEIIQDGDSGLLYSPGDYRELSSKIIELIDDSEKRNQIGLKAAKHALQNFSKEASVTAFLNLLHTFKKSPNQSSREFTNWVIGIIKDYLHILQPLLDERERTIHSLDGQLKEKERTLIAQQVQHEELVQNINSLTEQVSDNEQKIAIQHALLRDREQEANNLNSQIIEIDQRNKELATLSAKQDQQISSISSQKEGLQQELVRLRGHMIQREQILQGLNSQLLEIYSSTAWKIIQFLWKVRIWIAPHGSQREKLAYAIFGVFRKRNTFKLHEEKSRPDGNSSGAQPVTVDIPAINIPQQMGNNSGEELPVVSVIVPCYNDGQFLSDCLNSIYSQTYKPIEIIIINDGSTDETTNNILKNQKWPSVTVININHSGPSSARNAGIKIAKGKYILPLDADDKIHSTYIEKAVSILENQETTGIVYCLAEYFGNLEGRWELPPYSLEVMLLDNVIFTTSLFRKDDWQNVGGYDESLKHGMEDYDFWLSLLELGRDVVQLPEVLFYYRVRDTSRTNKFNEKIEQVQDTYLRIYRNHPRLFSRYQDEYSIKLRNALIELVFIKRQLERSQ